MFKLKLAKKDTYIDYTNKQEFLALVKEGYQEMDHFVHLRCVYSPEGELTDCFVIEGYIREDGDKNSIYITEYMNQLSSMDFKEKHEVITELFISDTIREKQFKIDYTLQQTPAYRKEKNK